jgi:hypothetical protein
MRQRTWIAVSVILLLALAILVPLSAGPPSGDDADPEEASWLSEEWRKSRKFWREVAVKARWETLPWLRMTPEKKYALWDEALLYALVEDDWLGTPSGEIPLQLPEPKYTPMVPGVSFKVVDASEISKLAEQQGQLSYIRVSGPSRWDRELSSVEVSVVQKVGLSGARRSDNERGCYRGIGFDCERTWGGWECHPVGKSSKCNELAFDDQRWQELEGLTMTPEDKHAIWNSMLEHAEEFLDNPRRVIILRSEGLDPTYVPAVEGMSFRLLSGVEIEELADSHGPVEYVRLPDWYSWYRGPVTVLMSTYVNTWKEQKTEPIAGTPWKSRTVSSSRSVGFKCRRSSVGWSCEPR